MDLISNSTNTFIIVCLKQLAESGSRRVEADLISDGKMFLRVGAMAEKALLYLASWKSLADGVHRRPLLQSKQAGQSYWGKTVSQITCSHAMKGMITNHLELDPEDDWPPMYLYNNDLKCTTLGTSRTVSVAAFYTSFSFQIHFKDRGRCSNPNKKWVEH